MSENINHSQNTEEVQNLNEILKVRRQKLGDLQSKGKDPFKIVKYDVTQKTKEITDNFDEFEGKKFHSRKTDGKTGNGEDQFLRYSGQGRKNSAFRTHKRARGRSV